MPQQDETGWKLGFCCFGLLCVARLLHLWQGLVHITRLPRATFNSLFLFPTSMLVDITRGLMRPPDCTMSSEHYAVKELLFLQKGPMVSCQFLWKKWKMSLQCLVGCHPFLHLPTNREDWPTRVVPNQWDFPPHLFSRYPHGSVLLN